mmetsp:Transcript_13994/g.30981  ORF Transcript_13994/g.30981 Transcript_13994/m.30981 type:complete len:253 (+) Transcript_13994:721-1479(+)
MGRGPRPILQDSIHKHLQDLLTAPPRHHRLDHIHDILVVTALLLHIALRVDLGHLSGAQGANQGHHHALHRSHVRVLDPHLALQVRILFAARVAENCLSHGLRRHKLVQRLGQPRKQVVMERQALQLLHCLPHEPCHSLGMRHRHCLSDQLIPTPSILTCRQVERQKIRQHLPALHVDVPHPANVKIPHRLNVTLHRRLQRGSGLEQAEIEQRELRRRWDPQHLSVNRLDDHTVKLGVVHWDHQHLLSALSD